MNEAPFYLYYCSKKFEILVWKLCQKYLNLQVNFLTINSRKLIHLIVLLLNLEDIWDGEVWK